MSALKALLSLGPGFVLVGSGATGGLSTGDGARRKQLPAMESCGDQSNRLFRGGAVIPRMLREEHSCPGKCKGGMAHAFPPLHNRSRGACAGDAPARAQYCRYAHRSRYDARTPRWR